MNLSNLYSIEQNFTKFNAEPEKMWQLKLRHMCEFKFKV